MTSNRFSVFIPQQGGIEFVGNGIDIACIHRR